MLRIAHFIQRYPPALGGSEAYFHRLSRYFVGLGHQVTVWTSNAIDLSAFWAQRGRVSTAGDSNEDGVTVRRFACQRWPLRRYFLKAASFLGGPTWKALTMPSSPTSLTMWRETGRALEPVDIVHATSFPYGFPIACARRLARRLKARFFITPFLHLGSPDVFNDPARRAYLTPHLQEMLRSADGIFVQTPSERAAVLGLGIDPDRVTMQGMGVDPTECTDGQRARARGNWDIGMDEAVVGHLANLSFEKGSIDLLLAAAEAWKQGAQFRLVLAGPNMSNFQRFWHTFPDKNRVTLLGELTDTQKRDFFAGIDVFALPSRSDSFGLVILEAWCNGVPTIAYRCGGIADVIRHDEDGLLVRCGPSDRLDWPCIQELATGLGRLSADADLRLRLGNAGRDRAVRDLSWERSLDVVRRVYEKNIPS